jgi:hypothetical protein
MSVIPRVALAFVAGLAVAAPVSAQADLVRAADKAAAAWLAHDAAALVGRSSAVVLQIPGADPSAPLGRAQAVELLRRHFQSAAERRVDVATTREVEAGRGVVELDRHYVVRGTSDERRETVFLGFRLVQGQWMLSEVRTAP